MTSEENAGLYAKLRADTLPGISQYVIVLNTEDLENI
jgi:hypothetical protein